MDQSSFIGNIFGMTQHSKNVRERLRKVNQERRSAAHQSRQELLLKEKKFKIEMGKEYQELEEYYLNRSHRYDGEEGARKAAQKRFEEYKDKRERAFEKEKKAADLAFKKRFESARKEAIMDLRKQYEVVDEQSSGDGPISIPFSRPETAQPPNQLRKVA